MHGMAGIDRSKLSGLAQDIGDVGIATPERIIEPNHRHGFRFAKKGQTLGQLAKVDRTSQILQRWIIAITGFAAGKFERAKKATLAIVSAIGAAPPSKNDSTMFRTIVACEASTDGLPVPSNGMARILLLVWNLRPLITMS